MRQGPKISRILEIRNHFLKFTSRAAPINIRAPPPRHFRPVPRRRPLNRACRHFGKRTYFHRLLLTLRWARSDASALSIIVPIGIGQAPTACRVFGAGRRPIGRTWAEGGMATSGSERSRSRLTLSKGLRLLSTQAGRRTALLSLSEADIHGRSRRPSKAQYGRSENRQVFPKAVVHGAAANGKWPLWIPSLRLLPTPPMKPANVTFLGSPLDEADRDQLDVFFRK